MAKTGAGGAVAEVKGVGVSASGKNWKIETDKGIFNMPKKNFAKAGVEIGSVYFFIWDWFEVPGKDNRMRIVDDYRVAGPDDVDSEPGQAEGQTTTSPKNTQGNGQQTQKSAHEVDPTLPLNGPTQGMIVNNAVLIVTSRMTLPGTKTDPASVKADIDYWIEWLDKKMRSGKLYEPF